MSRLQISGRITNRLVILVVFIIIFSTNIECLLRKGGHTLKLKRGDTNGGYGLNYSPPNYSSVIIWLHGLCGSAMDWERFVLLVNKKGFLPKTKWILPTSRFRKITAIYGNKCPAWFDITSFSPTENVEDVDGILESARRVRGIIMSEIRQGIDPSKIFLIGFSQGSAMALLSSIIMRDIILGGVIGVSGWIPMISHLQLGSESPLNDEDFDFNVSDEKKSKTRVFIFHGSKDNVIPLSVFFQTAIFMNIELGIKNISQRLYYDIKHSITGMQGVHMMYEISKMADPDHIHDELITLINSTLSHNSYSLVLKISDPVHDQSCYKFMPCDPTLDGNTSCSIDNCKCTNKMAFYEESKFFDYMKNRNFGQFNYPYAIFQAVPSEKTLKSNGSSSGGKGKKDNVPDISSITIDLDGCGNVIPNLFNTTSIYYIKKGSPEGDSTIQDSNDSDDIGALNETSTDSLSFFGELDMESSNITEPAEVDHSVSTNKTAPSSKHISFRKQGSFDDIMNHRFLLSMERDQDRNVEESPEDLSYHSELYMTMGASGTVGLYKDQEEEEEEEEEGEVEEKEKVEKLAPEPVEECDDSFSTDVAHEANTTVANTTEPISQDPELTTQLAESTIPTTISHGSKPPFIVRHYRALDVSERRQDGESGMNSDIGNFTIAQYMELISNQSSGGTIQETL
ncbi:hypothetical protein OIY81_1155 [Cryptosporidium canis]|nr:hypothetical protein OIY81_1155 [Cryptosporidium canis]